MSITDTVPGEVSPFEKAISDQAAKDATKKEFVIDIKNVDIKGLLKTFTKEYADANHDKVAKKVWQPLIAEEVKRLTPNYVQVGERKQVKIKGQLHYAFKECLFLAQHERQLFIAGPAGSGKTTLCGQIAEALELEFSFISCSAGLSEAHLLGRMLFDGTYVSSDFVERYEKGGVFLFDEVDAADANTLLTVNSALANGILSVPNRKSKPRANRHKDFICVVAGNTWGNGSFEYHGRNHLDAAFLDRFALSKVVVDYDKKLEKEICSSCPELANELWKIREGCAKEKVRKIVSTRAFISGSRQVSLGKEIKDIVDRLFIGWSKEEIQKVYPKNSQNTSDVNEGGF